jgi:hypothetical protein
LQTHAAISSLTNKDGEAAVIQGYTLGYITDAPQSVETQNQQKQQWRNYGQRALVPQQAFEGLYTDYIIRVVELRCHAAAVHAGVIAVVEVISKSLDGKLTRFITRDVKLLAEAVREAQRTEREATDLFSQPLSPSQSQTTTPTQTQTQTQAGTQTATSSSSSSTEQAPTREVRPTIRLYSAQVYSQYTANDCYLQLTNYSVFVALYSLFVPS